MGANKLKRLDMIILVQYLILGGEDGTTMVQSKMISLVLTSHDSQV